MTTHCLDHQPAVKFELNHNLSGIAGRYTFPTEAGMDWSSMQHRIFKLQGFPGTPLYQELLNERINSFGTLVARPHLTESHLRADKTLCDQFDKWATDARAGEIRKMFDILETQNRDQFGKLQFDRNNEQDIYNVVHGIISGFNTDDINYYINDHFNEIDRSKRKNIQKTIGHLLNKSGFRTVGWVASVETLEKIEEQLKERSSTTAENTPRKSCNSVGIWK